MRIRNIHVSMITLIALICAGSVAWAQSAADKAAADSLFQEGRQLISKGEAAAACKKFEASLSKVIQLGTQLALASCYEMQGRTASAYGMFHAAATTARKIQDRRQQYADDHATVLEGKLSRLAVTLAPGSQVDGLEIKRDGTVVTPAELGSPVPVDPGEHVIETRAPGRTAWSITVTISPTPGVLDVPLPPLAEAPPDLGPAAKPATHPEHAEAETTDKAVPARRKRRLIAYGLGGGGAAFIGTSLILGEVANSRWSAAQSHCNNRQCDPTGVALAGSARTLGNVSTGAFVVGFGAIAAGVIVYVTAPSAEHSRAASATALRVVPNLDRSQVGFAIQGGF